MWGWLGSQPTESDRGAYGFEQLYPRTQRRVPITDGVKRGSYCPWNNDCIALDDLDWSGIGNLAFWRISGRYGIGLGWARPRIAQWAAGASGVWDDNLGPDNLPRFFYSLLSSLVASTRSVNTCSSLTAVFVFPKSEDGTQASSSSSSIFEVAESSCRIDQSVCSHSIHDAISEHCQSSFLNAKRPLDALRFFAPLYPCER
jgi:hypothetical protein